ncbi:trypsin-like [Anticarsia gemmatalis]|uniref:trypsin-like n=1 Tax=Anticarsia gemmatalis TaxID=129554 RepID=UPI003F7683E7
MYKIFTFLVLAAFVACDPVPENAPGCQWEGVKGKCVEAHRCFTTLSRRDPKHPACTEQGEPSLICCTDCELVEDTRNAVIGPLGTVFWKDGRKARDQCLKYLSEVHHECAHDGYYGGISRYLDEKKNCHSVSYWAIGGAPPRGRKPTSRNPYEAVIGFGDGNVENALWKTSGAIISDKFILTTASGHFKAVPRFAALNVMGEKVYSSDWQVHNVKEVLPHPQYSEHSRDNDIALLQLETAITFNKNVLPACLPEPTAEFKTNEARTAIWKSSENTETFSKGPRIVEGEVLTAEECKARVSNLSCKELPQGVEADMQLCFDRQNDEENVLGSPLVVTTYISRCMNTLIGINTYGCQRIGIYTKVQQYVPWIESIAWP